MFDNECTSNKFKTIMYIGQKKFKNAPDFYYENNLIGSMNYLGIAMSINDCLKLVKICVKDTLFKINY